MATPQQPQIDANSISWRKWALEKAVTVVSSPDYGQAGKGLAAIAVADIFLRYVLNDERPHG